VFRYVSSAQESDECARKAKERDASTTGRGALRVTVMQGSDDPEALQTEAEAQPLAHNGRSDLEWHFLQCFGQPSAAETAPNGAHAAAVVERWSLCRQLDHIFTG
jgi:hypothetical protein